MYRSSPLGQNPPTANLGGRAQKGEERWQKEMIVRPVKATEDNLRVCLSFAATWRELIWAVSGTGCALRHGMGAVESTGVYWIAPHAVLEAQGLQARCLFAAH